MSKKIFILILLNIIANISYASTITFGQTAVTAGDNASLGGDMRDGILAAFKEVNDKGGINGNNLALNTINDNYEPENALKNSKDLIDQNVVALLGSVGTPTTKAILPVIAEKKVPLIAPLTGAEILRNPFNANIINIRASYFEETEEWINRVTKDLKATKIALLYQNDTFGQAGLAGVNKALDKRNLKLIASGTYERNTTSVKSALLDIKNAAPEVVLMVGTYKACAEFINLSAKLNFNPIFINISFVGTNALSKALSSNTQNVYVTQVVPSYNDASLNLVKNYNKALQALDTSKTPSFNSMEGYVAGRLIIEILKNMKGEVNKDKFMEAFWQTKNFNIDEFSLSFDQNNSNQGSHKIYWTKVSVNGVISTVDHL